MGTTQKTGTSSKGLVDKLVVPLIHEAALQNVSFCLKQKERSHQGFNKYILKCFCPFTKSDQIWFHDTTVNRLPKHLKQIN